MDDTNVFTLTCSSCGGEALHVVKLGHHAPRRPLCEECRRKEVAAYNRRRRRATLMGRSSVDALASPFYPKKPAERFASSVLPVAWTDRAGKKMLIRGMHTKLLTAILFGSRKVDGLLKAVCKELRTRDVGFKTIAKMNQLDPPPCACGGAGLYIVGLTTYCEECRPKAAKQRAIYSNELDVRAAEKSKDIDERQAAVDSAARHKAVAKIVRKR